MPCRPKSRSLAAHGLAHVDGRSLQFGVVAVATILRHPGCSPTMPEWTSFGNGRWPHGCRAISPVFPGPSPDAGDRACLVDPARRARVTDLAIGTRGFYRQLLERRVHIGPHGPAQRDAQAAARCVQQMIDAFRFLIMATRLEQGCVGCSVWHAPTRPCTTWKSGRPKETPGAGWHPTLHLAALADRIGPGPPHVRFDFVSARAALTTLRKSGIAAPRGTWAVRSTREKTTVMKRAEIRKRAGEAQVGCAIFRTGSRRRACASSSCSRAATAPAKEARSAR